MTNISTRKSQHLQLAKDPNAQNLGRVFDKYLLPYSSLPEINLSDVDSSIELLNKKVAMPLIISSMTGGTDHAKTINSNLAIVCEKRQIPFGVGSQRIALVNESAIESFSIVRKLAPSTVIFANMGAVQLNYGYTIESYKRVVDMIQADGLYLHLNPLQEALQPEGDTNFSNLFKKIETLVKHLKVPIIVKEVGHGLDLQTIRQLSQIGVYGVDVAGVGGTSWSWIEAQRRGNQNLATWFKDFGYPTDYLISNVKSSKIRIIASGGIRSPIDGLKSHLLGADLFAAAIPFLEPALESPQVLDNLVEDWMIGLKIALFSIGAKNWTDAKNKKLVVIK